MGKTWISGFEKDGGAGLGAFAEHHGIPADSVRVPEASAN
jgi:hypothetical protein